jgi:hypothetical protein
MKGVRMGGMDARSNGFGRPQSDLSYFQAMGYMGFGMRKEAYTRDPRGHMTYLKPFLKGGRRRPAPVDSSASEPVSVNQQCGQAGSNRLAQAKGRRLVGLVIALLAAAAATYLIVELVLFVLNPKHMIP